MSINNDVLATANWTYVFVAILAIVCALTLVQARRQRIAWTLTAAGLLVGYLLVTAGHAWYLSTMRAERLKIAQERFQERCKTAGETIKRTVADVHGIVMLKTRSEQTQPTSQFEMDDPYGRNCTDKDDCIAAYLFDYKMVQGSPAGLNPVTPRLYQFVDVESPTGGYRRYTKEFPNGPLIQRDVQGERPRYGVMWKDVSTKGDRDYWIAGGVIQIVDLITKEVVAERRGYLLDLGQGDTRNFRDPWAAARSQGQACPALQDHNQNFVVKVLQPPREKL